MLVCGWIIRTVPSANVKHPANCNIEAPFRQSASSFVNVWTRSDARNISLQTPYGVQVYPPIDQLWTSGRHEHVTLHSTNANGGKMSDTQLYVTKPRRRTNGCVVDICLFAGIARQTP